MRVPDDEQRCRLTTATDSHTKHVKATQVNNRCKWAPASPASPAALQSREPMVADSKTRLLSGLQIHSARRVSSTCHTQAYTLTPNGPRLTYWPIKLLNAGTAFWSVCASALSACCCPAVDESPFISVKQCKEGRKKTTPSSLCGAAVLKGEPFIRGRCLRSAVKTLFKTHEAVCCPDTVSANTEGRK